MSRRVRDGATAGFETNLGRVGAAQLATLVVLIYGDYGTSGELMSAEELREDIVSAYRIGGRHGHHIVGYTPIRSAAAIVPVGHSSERSVARNHSS